MTPTPNTIAFQHVKTCAGRALDTLAELSPYELSTPDLMRELEHVRAELLTIEATAHRGANR